MSCIIANGRLEACKDSISGLDAVYFINYGDITGVTLNATFPDDFDAVQGVANLYKFELKGANSFEQAITSSRENGTTFVEQTLIIQLKRQDSQSHKTVKLLSYGRPHVVVKTKAGQFFLAGYNFGMDLTAGGIMSGTAMGDYNGYQLTFTVQEPLAANILQVGGNTDALLATFFDDATIVTS